MDTMHNITTTLVVYYLVVVLSQVLCILRILLAGMRIEHVYYYLFAHVGECITVKYSVAIA